MAGAVRPLGELREEEAVAIAALASIVSLLIIMVLTYRDPLLAGHRGAGPLAAGAWVASYGVMWLRAILTEDDPTRDL
jgi:hypothetical protein